MADGSHRQTDALSVERDGTVWDHAIDEEEAVQKKEPKEEGQPEFNADVYLDYIE